MPNTIEILIEHDGTPTVTTKGVKGKGCSALTKPLEDAFGGDVVSDTKTGEYYEASDVKVTQKATQRA
jgi:Protein of unknown function (DUF2997)